MRNFIDKVNNVEIHNVEWTVDNPKAGLLIVHGYAEHSGRYEHVAKFFNDHGFIVRSFDFYGHGRSGGLQAYVDTFDVYIGELETKAAQFRSEYPNLRMFVLGHSMGGLVAAMAAAKNRIAGIENLILSNPGLDINTNQPRILVGLIRLLAWIAPKIKTTKLSNEYISRDEQVRKSYDEDPLNYREGTKPGFADKFDRAGQWMRENAHLINQNLYLNYSLADKVVYPKASEVFFEKVSSEDKKLTEYKGLYHELLNEPEKEEVLKKMLQWCEERIH